MTDLSTKTGRETLLQEFMAAVPGLELTAMTSPGPKKGRVWARSETQHALVEVSMNLGLCFRYGRDAGFTADTSLTHEQRRELERLGDRLTKATGHFGRASDGMSPEEAANLGVEWR